MKKKVLITVIIILGLLLLLEIGALFFLPDSGRNPAPTGEDTALTEQTDSTTLTEPTAEIDATETIPETTAVQATEAITTESPDVGRPSVDNFGETDWE